MPTLRHVGGLTGLIVCLVLAGACTGRACFNPRHGIRVSHNTKRTDFVICFECLQVKVHGEGQGDFLVSDFPKAIFDKVLRDAGVPLP